MLRLDGGGGRGEDGKERGVAWCRAGLVMSGLIVGDGVCGMVGCDGGSGGGGAGGWEGGSWRRRCWGRCRAVGGRVGGEC